MSLFHVRSHMDNKREGVAMPSVEESIVIDRPAEDVFAFVTTPENDRLWSSTAVERVREGDEPIRVGSRIRAVDKFLGRRVESTLHVTEHDPSRRSMVRIEGPFKATGSYVLEPLEGRTRFPGAWKPSGVSAGSISAGSRTPS